MSIISITLSLIFLGIAAIHFYWASGSEWAFDSVLPTEMNGKRLFTPRRIESGIVALGLVAFALFYLVKGNILPMSLPDSFLYYTGWVIPAIFALRAIGDFKYAGIFKKIKNTQFARNDNNMFIPICLTLAILGLIDQLF